MMSGYWEKETSVKLHEYAIENEYFTTLPTSKQAQLKESYAVLSKKVPGRSAYALMEDTFHLAVWGIPPFVKAWLLFSVMICLMLLFSIDGATSGAWILPVIVAVHAYFNLTTAPPPYTSADLQLFPEEEVIWERYVTEKPSDDINEQRRQLLQGWRDYLIREWLKELPATDEEQMIAQSEQGEFAFNIARIELRENTPLPSAEQKLSEKKAPLLLFSYVMWNILFAVIIDRKQN